MSVDGRTARRNRNRDAVLDTTIELFSEGYAPPSPTLVAERSGVSLRSVYRYFADHDALVTAAAARFVARNERLFAIGIGTDAPLADRIAALVDARLELYEAVAPVARVVVRRGADLPVVANQLASRRQMLREQTAEVFAAELAGARAGVADAVDALTQFEAVEYLRYFRGLPVGETRAALVDGLARLLGD